MDRLERLLDLLATLLDTDRLLTRAELARRVPGYPEEGEAARRAFERDKDALRSMGIPVEVEHLDPRDQGSPLGYRVRREAYELPDPGLTEEEVAALHLAVATVTTDDAGGTGAASEALRKLGGAHERIEPPAGVAAALPGSGHLPALFGAVAERRRVRFTYKGKVREADPWRLACRRGSWYLTALDHTHGSARLFRVDRLEGDVEVLGPAGAFAPPPEGTGTPPPPWLLGEEVVVEALLLVDADQAPWAEAAAGTGAVVQERRPDGSVVLRLPVANEEAFFSFALGFLGRAEVVGPPALRDRMVAWLEALAAA